MFNRIANILFDHPRITIYISVELNIHYQKCSVHSIITEEGKYYPNFFIVYELTQKVVDELI